VGIASYSQNPNDEIMPLPWVGYTGFRGAAAETPPATWEREHLRAESGGWYREGRRWQAPDLTLSAVPVKALPTRVLYRPMIERSSLAAAERIGYTVDQ